MGNSFDELEAAGLTGGQNTKPLWKVIEDSKGSDTEILKWLNAEFEFLKDESKDRIEEISKNMKVYRGKYNETSQKTTDRDISFDKKFNQKKIVINHVFDFVEQKVSKLSRYKPNVVVIPQHNEFKDKIDATMIKLFWDHIKLVQNFDDKNRKVIRHSKISGLGPMGIFWDPEAGIDHPDVKLLKQRKETKMDVNGKEVDISDAVIKIGDVVLKPLDSRKLYYEKKLDSFEEPDYCFYYTFKNIYELKSKHPEKSGEITQDSEIESQFHAPKKYLSAHCVEIEFWHKKTFLMPEGYYAKFVKKCILKKGDLPYKHGEIPIEVLPDIVCEDEQYPDSFISMVKMPNAQINNITTMAMRNLKLVSHPKWMVPKGSIKLESLNNDISFVQFAGAQAPQLATPTTIPSDYFTMRKELKGDMEQMTGVYGVSRGQPPPGIKAGIALQFLNEQENERDNNNVAQYNNFIVRVATKAIKTAGQYYDPSDKRTLQIMGRDQQWMTKEFDPSVFASPFDVRVQNSTSLPESKAARMQTLLDLKDKFPNAVSDSQVLDLLDFAQTDKYYDLATSAVRTAEMENEKIIYEGELIDPQEYEIHVKHWMVHVSIMQQVSFKLAPKKAQTKLKEHVLAHEYLMFKIVEQNPLYQQQLAVLEQFPMFYANTPTIMNNLTPEMKESMEAEAQMGPNGQPLPPPAPEVQTPQVPGPQTVQEEQVINPDLNPPPIEAGQIEQPGGI